jgi:hypothetical protein
VVHAPPSSCPLPSYGALSLRWTGRYATYTDADTWFPSWDLDGNLYSPFTDGRVGEYVCWSFGDPAYTGNAVIRGEDPLALDIEAIGLSERPNPDVRGHYPCGSLCHGGVWYYGIYYVNHYTFPNGGRIHHELGPFAGCRYSIDHGLSWTDSPCTVNSPLFPERGRTFGEAPIKFGAPNFVDFGQDMQHSPDGYAYLIAHGTASADGISSWPAGDALFLARVKPSTHAINNAAAYEFFAGASSPEGALWTRDFAGIVPMLEWPAHAGVASMTYNSGLGEYMLTVCVAPWHGGIGTYNTWFALADNPWGPWSLLSYLESFGTQAYHPHIPSKFIDPEGRTAWLIYSANWQNYTRPEIRVVSDPVGSRYALCIREFELIPA